MKPRGGERDRGERRAEWTTEGERVERGAWKGTALTDVRDGQKDRLEGNSPKGTTRREWTEGECEGTGRKGNRGSGPCGGAW